MTFIFDSEDEYGPMAPSDAQRHLIEGLAAGHGDLFRNSPSFHAQITALANLLPLWVNGMAADAKSSDHAYAQHQALQRIELHPLCVCGHSKISHTGDSACTQCAGTHAYEPRWVLAQCETWVPEAVARKTGFPMSPTGSRCLKEKGHHDPATNQHVACDGEQWVAWG